MKGASESCPVAIVTEVQKKQSEIHSVRSFCVPRENNLPGHATEGAPQKFHPENKILFQSYLDLFGEKNCETYPSRRSAPLALSFGRDDAQEKRCKKGPHLEEARPDVFSRW